MRLIGLTTRNLPWISKSQTLQVTNHHSVCMACQPIRNGGHGSFENNYNLIPIGYLKSCFKTKNGTPRQPSVCSFAKAKLKIDKSIYQRPDHSLEGLELFSHIWVIYIFHQNATKVFTKAKVKPPRLDGQKTGVFACRSPYRPNPIGLTLARLDSVAGDTLHISGIDIIDGTPVLDIKPYIPEYDCVSVELPVMSGNGDLTKQQSLHVSSDQNCSLVKDEATKSESISRSPSLGNEVLISNGNNRIPTYCQEKNTAGSDQLKLENNKYYKPHFRMNCPVDGDINAKDFSVPTTGNSSCEVPTTATVNVGDWVASPPIPNLKVRFTPGAIDDLKRFHNNMNSSQGSSSDKFSMEFFKNWSELKEAITSILSADPRSTYRRNSCSDRLYYFPLDNAHITCWFRDDLAEVLMVQPLCDAEIPKK